MKLKLLIAGALAVVALAPVAKAATVTWTNWTNLPTSTGNTGGAIVGSDGAVTVSYTGELQQLVANYPSWTPAASYEGGNVSNAPPASGGILRIFGGPDTATDTITFSHAVLNPVVAIWSLGQGGVDASFDFSATPIFEAGGPSAEYGGESIIVSGNSVSGREANGVVEFAGSVQSISFTTPTYENWYGFTVGYLSAVPEPASWALMMTGLGLVGGTLRSQRRQAAAAV